MTSELPQRATYIDTIICPQCHETLDAEANHCPKCNASTMVQRTDLRLIDRPWLIVVTLLHLGVLGIPLYWCTKYTLATRIALVLASIIYTIGAVGAIIWGILQIVNAFSY